MHTIIFDFDNCLAPGDAVGEEVLLPLFTSLEAREGKRLDTKMCAEMRADFWRKPLDFIIDKYQFSKDSIDESFSYFRKLETKKKIYGYVDTTIVKSIPGKKFLVTSGFEKFQRSKIASLGIKDVFDGIYYDDPGIPPRRGKAFYFEQIAKTENVAYENIWVIGDSADSEIAAGNLLGMRTVQILRPNVQKSETAQYHVASLNEFIALIKNS